MKDASLPTGMEAARCWCGDVAKVKESIDFSYTMGRKFFRCPNYEHDPPPTINPYERPVVCLSIVSMFVHSEHDRFVVVFETIFILL
jgi:hypothetical protein